MAILKTGTNSGTGFTNTMQVTADRLNNAVNAAKFIDGNNNAVANSGNGTCVPDGGVKISNTGQLEVENGKITLAKLSTSPSASLADLQATAIYGIMDKVYPVGSIFLSGVATDPDELLFGNFGHTSWSQIEGRFIVGVGSHTDNRNQSKTFALNNQSGNYSEKISINQMPSHSHSMPSRLIWKGDDNNSRLLASGGGMNTGKTGGGAAHNNIPPYIAKYIWQRTN